MKPVVYVRHPDIRGTKTYQDVISNVLKQRLREGEVKKEWCIGAGASDIFSYKHIYRPRVDIAVGPFNIHIADNHLINMGFIKNTPLLIKLFQAKGRELDVSLLNKNPRCLLAIELLFSGSSKHMLGDFANASMMGLAGVIVTSKRNYKKVARLAKYLEYVQQLGKAPVGLFSNVLVFEADEFLEVISK